MHKLKVQPKLLYRGSVNGWKGKDFHSCCDNKGPTISLFLSDKGTKFGGFTSENWDKSGKYKQDSSCFLFSLDNKQIFPVKKPNEAIGCFFDRGP